MRLYVRMIPVARYLARLAVAAARYAAKGTLLFFLVLVINPFGSAEAGDQLSHQIWQKIYADQYAGRSTKNAVEDITVVTIDDESKEVAAPANTLPDSANFLAIFRTITGMDSNNKRPRALFIDLLMGDFAPDKQTAVDLLSFDQIVCPHGIYDDDRTHNFGLDEKNKRKDPPEGFSPFKCMLKGIAEMTRYEDWRKTPSCFESDLRKLACIREKGGVPVIIANAVDPRGKSAVVSSPGAQALATVAISAPVLVSDRAYPLVYPNDPESREKQTFSLYPAAVLYAAWCADPTAKCDANPALQPDPNEAKRKRADWLNKWHWSASFDQPLDVTWGVRKKDDPFANMVVSAGPDREKDCRTASPGWATLAAFMKAWFTGLGFTRGEPCLYQHHLTYAQWRRAAGGTSAAVFPASAYEGKIVLIGMEDKESNDFIAAAPYSMLPGVYYHAMALDNLIEHGANYPKTAVQILPPLTISDQDCWNAFAAFLILLAVGVVHTLTAHRGGVVTRPWRELGVALLAVAAVAAYMFVILIVLSGGKVQFLPDRFNIAALGIVLVAEVVHVAVMLSGPALRALLGRGLHAIANEIEAQPVHAASPAAPPPAAVTRRPRSTRSKKQSEGVSDT